MAAQLALRTGRLQTGDTSLGWKVGFGAPAAMQRLGIQSPLVGFLCAAARVPDNSTVSLHTFTQAVVEPEIAVHMKTDLGPNADELMTRAAIAGLGPAIELADLSFPPDSVEKILASNIYQRGVILGPVDTGRAGADLRGLSGQLFKDGVEIARTSNVEANTGTIVNIIAGVAECLAGFGLVLRAGEVVIVGSMVPPVIVDRPCSISFVLTPYDAIAVRFAA